MAYIFDIDSMNGLQFRQIIREVAFKQGIREEPERNQYYTNQQSHGHYQL